MRNLPFVRWLLAAALVTTACSGGDSEGTGAGGSGSGARRDGGGAGSGAAGDIAQIIIDASAGGVGDSGAAGRVGGGSLDDAACATETRRGERVPLDLYIALDSSGSMSEAVGTGVAGSVSKWQAVSQALIAFLRDPGSVGLGVGLQYFPLTRPGIPAVCATDAECNGRGPCDLPRTCRNAGDVIVGCATSADCGGGECVLFGQCLLSGGYCLPIGGVCEGNAGLCVPIGGNCRGRDICETAPYAVPAVNIAPLPGVAPAIIRSLETRSPDGLTPTSSALGGALDHARTVSEANPTRRVVVVLATDGTPTECEPTDIPSISRLAAVAAGGTPPIATFVIGVFAPSEAVTARPNLDAIAAAGGSGSALIVQTNQDVSQAFLAALNTVRTTALSCEYTIPKPATGVLDYQSVNVRYTSGAGATATLGYAANAAGCGQAGGWYYDPPLGGAFQPTKIQMCPTTCTGLKADTNGQVNILLGCKTESIVN